MNRVVVHLSDSTVFGGTEQALIDLAVQQMAQGWRPCLLHLRAGGAPRLVAAAESAGVPQAHVEAGTGWRGLAHVPRLARCLQRWRPDVVHAHLSFPLACRFGVLAAAVARIPAVVATAQLYTDLPPSGQQQWRVVRPCIHRHVAVSEGVARRWREALGVPASRIRVVPNAVRALPPRMRDARPPAGWPTVPAGVPVLLTVARLDAQKGHATLLEALAALPQAHLVLAGDGPLRGPLENQARALGVSARVTFLGEREDARTLPAWADLVVLPSINEGLPLALLEALHAGRPVVASAIEGIVEVMTDGVTGRLVRPGDARALAAAMAGLLAAPAEATRLGAAGRARAEAHASVPAVAAAIAQVYLDAAA